ncbi:hypothetical protein ACIGT4_31500 [Streptomyces sioyaensis]|uniref:hypothetical protein n=1 Tax=Streptomyces sioyaensis TaxID=67364 RepID=UPI0037CE0C10
MRSSSKGATLVANPNPDEWDFGDFPYGLEPLIMPPIGYATTTSVMVTTTQHLSCDHELAVFQLRMLAAGELTGESGAVDKPSDAQLFWFRWITGHQISFLIWYLMGRALEEVEQHGDPDGSSLARLETYAYGYCVMLLYTGSCPLELYQTLIRPRMFLQHRSFSGTWAPDFALVRRLFRGRGLAQGTSPQTTGLARAVGINKKIHDGIAARLAPEGKSLLQQAAAETITRPSPRTAALYDNFFMTLRAPIEEPDVTAQLLRRLRAVALDIATHGLYPLGHEGEARPEELRSAEVTRCENRIGRLLYELGEAAASDTRASAERVSGTPCPDL